MELVYIDNDGYRSAVTDLVVASYVRLDTNASGTPAEPETSQPPTPGEDFEVGGGNDANSGCDENEEDCIDRPTEEPQVDEVGWVVSYANGQVTLQGPTGFAKPGSVVVVSNLNTGDVVTELANETNGAVKVAIAAENGHRILVFAQDAADAAATSPAKNSCWNWSRIRHPFRQVNILGTFAQ